MRRVLLLIPPPPPLGGTGRANPTPLAPLGGFCLGARAAEADGEREN